ncbi:MAG TPA: hypothetical protein O0X70_00535 [Methanocorpusculum sp.]|nr:hypothetical protein [Methanocorpusculum sp.]
MPGTEEEGFWSRLVWRFAMTEKRHAWGLFGGSVVLAAAGMVLYKGALAFGAVVFVVLSGIAVFLGVMGVVTAVMMLFMQKVKRDIREELERGRD